MRYRLLSCLAPKSLFSGFPSPLRLREANRSGRQGRSFIDVLHVLVSLVDQIDFKAINTTYSVSVGSQREVRTMDPSDLCRQHSSQATRRCASSLRLKEPDITFPGNRDAQRTLGYKIFLVRYFSISILFQPHLTQRLPFHCTIQE